MKKVKAPLALVLLIPIVWMVAATLLSHAAADIVVSGCDRTAQRVAELVVVLDDALMADTPDLEAVVKIAAFLAVAEPDFPGPNSYDRFVHGLHELPQAIQDVITDAVYLRYTGESCR